MLNGTGPGALPIDVGNNPASLPGYQFESGMGEFTNGFTLGSGGAARSFRLKPCIRAKWIAACRRSSRHRTSRQELKVTYSSPVPWLDGNGPATRMTERVTLVPARNLKAAAEITTRTFTFGDVQITTRFRFWNPEDNFIVKTLPVAEWVDTVITGLTSTPITLTNSFAQSYGPGHHNFTEDFIFEPGLDPSVTPAQKAELNAENIRLIHVFHNQMDFGFPGGSGDKLTILGLDGIFRVASQVTLQDVHLNVGKTEGARRDGHRRQRQELHVLQSCLADQRRRHADEPRRPSGP